MQSSLLDYAFSVLAFYKTVAGLRVKAAANTLLIAEANRQYY